MKKIGELDDGTVLVALSPSEWGLIAERGIEKVLDEKGENLKFAARREQWQNSSLFRVLQEYDKAIARRIYYQGVTDGLDCTPEFLSDIAENKRFVRNMGVKSRFKLREFLAGLQSVRQSSL